MVSCGHSILLPLAVLAEGVPILRVFYTSANGVTYTCITIACWLYSAGSCMFHAAMTFHHPAVLAKGVIHAVRALVLC